MAQDSNLFNRLTKLFRSGPVIKRRVREVTPSTKSTSAFEQFRKAQSYVYSSAMSAYGSYDRMARYSDFQEMEYTPEIASALDIYSEETISPDEKGNVLHIHSENPVVHKLLNELFYDTLNVNFNLTAWARNMCKYGDFFLFNDVSPDQGVINVYPIPVNEIEREEGYDKDDPMAVRFRWLTQGNQVLENWQVSHFRILGNDAFLPYGSSVLEAARRIWRQLILVEDAMLVYRVVRAPDRRVFYIDVGNVPPEDIANYMEQAQAQLKKSQVVDKQTGRVDLRYNPLSVDEDYFIPVRGGQSGTKIEPLAGGANAAAIEDVQYIQKKMFAALKIPKAYLGYDEGLGAKATLSQEDIRFSRTIARIQRTIVSELNKIAIIHLHSNGFDGPDLLDFDLKLTNPSTIAQQQKLELYNTKFQIAGSANGIPNLVDKRWVRKKIFQMTDEEIDAIEKGIIKDKEMELKVEAVKLPEDKSTAPDMSSMAAGIPTSPFASEPEAPASEPTPPAGGEAPPAAPTAPGPETASSNTNKRGLGILAEPDFDLSNLSINDESAPIKAQNTVDAIGRKLLGERIEGKTKADRDRYNAKRKRRGHLHNMSDHNAMVSHDKSDQTDSIAHPFGAKNDLINPFKDVLKEIDDDVDPDDDYTFNDTRMSEIHSVLGSMRRKNIFNRQISASSNTTEEDE
jgi:hypothetical protein